MRLALVVPLIFTIVVCKAQQPEYTAFTVSDGLPSNYLYRCIEDNRGFLWVATDAGIARFDGKHFQVFTTKDGLPDNEVLDVVKEKNGRIWVNCFKQSPSYFDEAQNKFFNAETDSNLAKGKYGTRLTYIYALYDGGVMYSNDNGCFVFKDKKLVLSITSPEKALFFIKQNVDGTQIRYGSQLVNPFNKTVAAMMYEIKDGRLTDSLELSKYHNIGSPLTAVNDSSFYVLFQNQRRVYRYSAIRVNYLRAKVDSVTVPENFFYYGFTDVWLCCYTISGKIYVFDKKTLRPQFVISGNYIPGALYKDNKGNIWISSIDKGLILYKKRPVGQITMPRLFNNTNFLSIAYLPGGRVLAGNYNGELLEKKGVLSKVYNCPLKSIRIFRQRKIILSQGKIFTFSENGIFIDNVRQVTSKKGFVFGKTAISLNDSFIIVGTSTGLVKLNTVTEKVLALYPVGKRVTALVKAANNIIYFGSTDGLYKYDVIRDSAWNVGKVTQPFTERVTGLCLTPDSLLWIATAGSGIVVMKTDSKIFTIKGGDGLIDDAARCITAAKPGQVWAGTWTGISKIDYTLNNNRSNYTVQNLSVNDGLTNNVINEMVYHNDTMYAATADGISVIPTGISIPKFNIPVQLIKISVNQRDTVIANAYKLAYNQRNIQMQFAGIELSGHFKNLQYTLDKNSNWISLGENILALQLSSGRHAVQVRAVDVNRNISNNILTIQFIIATPFWQAVWFWLTVGIILQFAVIFFINSRMKKMRAIKLAKETAIVQTAALEQQAFTSLINPHFIFNALNSIQHYINLQDRKNANRYLSDFASLIRKSFESSQKSFIALDEELENTKIYLRLEQMRFSGRFTYKVNIDENMDIDDWMIPSMMLQPFLENAILHGIMPSAIDGEIIIDVKEQDNNLLLSITDNGIGIANSQALKGSDEHNSFGMRLIEKRIAALSRVSAKAITIYLSAARQDEKNPGTKILLIMQHGLHQAWLQAQK